MTRRRLAIVATAVYLVMGSAAVVDVWCGYCYVRPVAPCFACKESLRHALR